MKFVITYEGDDGASYTVECAVDSLVWQLSQLMETPADQARIISVIRVS